MKKNYIILFLIIILGIFIMTFIGFIYNKIDNIKLYKSYISNKVENYDYSNIDNGLNNIKNNGYLFLSYIGDKDIYKLEKYMYKYLRNSSILNNFVYIDCTKYLNNYKSINDLNSKLNVITDNSIILPAIIYYKDGKPIDYIDSVNSILTGDKFIQLMDKWEVEY